VIERLKKGNKVGRIEYKEEKCNNSAFERDRLKNS
jgi:hypothetical protein